MERRSRGETINVLMTDFQTPDTEFERQLITGNSHGFSVAQCTCADDVIEAATNTNADAIIASYAPIDRTVIETCQG